MDVQEFSPKLTGCYFYRYRIELVGTSIVVGQGWGTHCVANVSPSELTESIESGVHKVHLDKDSSVEKEKLIVQIEALYKL